MEILARQLSQLVRDAKRDLINELTRAATQYYENEPPRDIRLHIIGQYQLWRDQCISSSESIAENYLNNCILLNINYGSCSYILEESLASLLNETYNSVELKKQDAQYSAEAEGMMRPFLERRISEIIENAKDGFCRGIFIAKRGLPYQNVINAAEVTMGDKFENIHTSTIVNHSLVEKSFNKVRRDYDEETADVLKKIADVIEKSNNEDAAENFTSFNEELQKPEPKKSVLRSLWSGITTSLPTIVQMTDVVTKIDKLLN
jgi:hypothetical protein